MPIVGHMEWGQPAKSILIGVILCMSGCLVGQDYYYNTLHYGLYNTLMGGSVTAGGNDLSMGYYNPAALHLVESRGGISVVRPSLSRFGFQNVYGNNITSSDFDFGLTPSLATYKVVDKDDFRVLLITLQKSDWNIEYSVNGTLPMDDFDDNGSLQYLSRGDDYWIGGAGSLRLNDQLHIGLSQFISSASYRYNYKLIRKLTPQDQLQLDQYFSDEFKANASNSLSFVTKVGLQLQLPRHSFGLVVKTPNYLKLLRGGLFERETVFIRPSNSGVSNLINFDLHANIKTPWEFNLGYIYHLDGDDQILALNVSHHTAVDRYEVSHLQEIDAGTVGWYARAKAVTNFSIGYESQVNEKLGWVGSFRTNFLAYDNETDQGIDQSLYLLAGDRYHLAFGANLRLKEHTISLGLDWGFTGSQVGSVLQDFPGVSDLAFRDARLVNHSLTLIFTYGFIVQEIKERLDGGR